MAKGIVAGLVAALAGAALWAVITVTTNYQIGWMAVGIGYLVGLAVRKFGRGETKVFGVAGALIALLGCLLGNALSIIGFVSQQENIGFFTILVGLNYGIMPQVMIESFNPMDALFYGLALYEGFKFSIKPARSA